MAQAKDLTGQRFGRLTALRLDTPYISPTGKKTRRWVCRCDCGNEVTILTNQLTSGQTQSCGCLAHERRQKATVDLTGQRFGRWTVLRRERLPHAESNGTINGWFCRCDCGTERVLSARALTSGDSRSCGCLLAEQSTARLSGDNVTGRYDGTVVSTIRPGRAPNKNNKSGVLGVYWSEREGCWIAKIGVRGKSIMLGRYSRKEDAVKARQRAEDEYYAPIIEAYDGGNHDDK